MKYKVKHSAGEDPVVIYECPACRATLRSPLEEAGQRFKCPGCGAEIETPGKEDLEKHRSASIRREEERLREEQRRLDQIAEAQAAREASERRKQEEQRHKARAPAATPSRGRSRQVVVTGSVSIFSVILAIAVFHQFWVAPLKTDLRKTQAKREKLVAVVDENARIANSNQARTDSDIRLLSIDAHRHLR